jgi:hypothetical protein
LAKIQLVKVFIILLISIPLLAACRQQPNDQDLLLLNGYSYSLDSLKQTSDTVLYEKRWFNKQRKLVKMQRYWTDERGKRQRTAWYDEHDKLIKNLLVLKDSTYISSTEFKRDKHHQIIQQLMVDNGEHFTMNNQNEYNDAGLVIKSTMTPASAPAKMDMKAYTAVITYNYDAQNNQVLFRQTMGGSLVNEIASAYDSKGNKISEIEDNKAARKKTKRLFTYNSSNQKVKEEYYEKEMLLSTTVFTWTDGLVTEERTTYPNGEVQCTFFIRAK